MNKIGWEFSLKPYCLEIIRILSSIAVTKSIIQYNISDTTDTIKLLLGNIAVTRKTGILL